MTVRPLVPAPLLAIAAVLRVTQEIQGATGATDKSLRVAALALTKADLPREGQDLLAVGRLLEKAPSLGASYGLVLALRELSARLSIAKNLTSREATLAASYVRQMAGIEEDMAGRVARQFAHLAPSGIDGDGAAHRRGKAPYWGA